MFLDNKTKDIVAISLLSFVEALQVLVIVVLIFSFIPIPMPAFAQKLYPMSQYDIHLKREGSFFHFWVLFGLALQALVLFVNRRRLGVGQIRQKIWPYVATCAFFLYVQVFAVFKMFLFNNPGWAKAVFYAALAMGLAVRVFWPEYRAVIVAALTATIPRWTCLVWDAVMALVLGYLVFAPKLGEVLAQMFCFDRFYHFDVFVMAPAWGCHNGLVLNDQVASNYGLILPVLFNAVMGALGKFDYAHAVALMIAICAVYYLLFYGLLRCWLKSCLLAWTGVVLAVKLQFFHWGVYPLIWIYPSTTPLRYFPDVFFLFFVLQFTRHLQWRWLAGAAASAAVGLVWSVDVGIYMYVTLVLTVICGVYARRGGFRKAAAILMVPLIGALAILAALFGSTVFHPAFWHNTFEFASFFVGGWGALPMGEVKERQFFAFLMGYLIPLVYTAILLYGLGMFVLRRSGRHLFLLIVSVFGLGLYHYFLNRSAVTSYYVVVMPFVVILMDRVAMIIGSLARPWQRGIKLLLLAWSLTALATGALFAFYPNAPNPSGFDWARERAYYAQNSDFSRDAAFIDSLTAAGEAVPLISSFETKILMQAHRPPFFYIFPLMESEHMRERQDRGLYIYTYAQLERIMAQIRDRRPRHIFIEARILEGPQGKRFDKTNTSFDQMMEFIHAHYQYQASGQYLEAFETRS